MAQVNKSNCANVAEELILPEKRLEKKRKGKGREGKEKRRKFIGRKVFTACVSHWCIRVPLLPHLRVRASPRLQQSAWLPSTLTFVPALLQG